MRKANKNLIALCVVLISGLGTLTVYADPLTIGIGLPIAEATGIGFEFTGLTASGSDSWFNSQTNSDPVQLATNYVNVDLQNDVPIKYRVNNNQTVDFQIDKDSYVFKYFNNTDDLYTSGAIHTLIANNNIQEGVVSQEIYNVESLDEVPFNTELATIPFADAVYNLPAGVVLSVSGGNSKSLSFTYNNQEKHTGTWVAMRFPFKISYIKTSSTTFAIRYVGNGADYTIGDFTIASGSYIGNSIIEYNAGEDFIFDGDTNQYIHINVPVNQLSSLQLSNLFGNLTGEDFIDLTEDLARNYTDGILLTNVNSTYSDEDIGDSPPQPVPSIPLGQVPFDDWVDLWGQGINEQLEEQNNALDFIGQKGEDQIEELESIDNNLDDLNDTVDSIDTNVAQSTGLLGDIRSGIQSLGQTLSGTISDTLSDILDAVQELVQSVVLATETLIAGILNQIPAVFGVILTPIKQASSIWHYVVEWIGSIAAPFSWIRTMVGGTSYYILLPVYASLAGSVVLAFYKRFGK